MSKINPEAIRARIQDVARREAELPEEAAYDVAFHMTDWLDDLEAYWRFCAEPDKMSDEDVNKLLIGFLVHVPNHVAAAGKLHTGMPVQDIFEIGATVDDLERETLLGALKFAAHKHRHQRRKDAEGTPYINHPIAVVEVLARVGGVTDFRILQAAILHDTLEDTETTTGELDEEFGERVRRLVEEVTDDKRLPKEERKRLQIEHAPKLSIGARQIKLADKICNVEDITPFQPVDWPLERKRDYLDWAEKVVAGCRGSNAQLEQHFDAVLKKRRGTLEARA